MQRLFLSIFFSLILLGCSSKPTAPDITFSTITGEKIALSQLRGKPVLITFWATSCESCIKEVPQLIELHREFYLKGLNIIAVAMPYDPPSRVLEFSKLNFLPYRVALDMQSEAVNAFHVMATPTTVLIAPNGKMVWQKTGLFDVNELKTLLKE